MDPSTFVATQRTPISSPPSRFADSVLIDSPSRVVISLPSSPTPTRSELKRLPSISVTASSSSSSSAPSSEQSNSTSEQHEAAIEAEGEPEHGLDETSTMSTHRPRMLLDYLSRLGKFEPRLRRYVASKYSEESEPVLAFANSSATNSNSASPATPAPDAVNRSTTVRGFSLVDVERALLSATAKWWKGSGSSSKAAKAHHDDDEERLDIDLSALFGPPSSESSSSPTKIENSELPHDIGPDRFLHYYSHQDIIDVAESAGILSSLAAIGFTSPSLIFDTSDQFQHRISLIDSSLFTNPSIKLTSSERFLLDLHMKRRRGYNTDASVSWQLMNRLIKAGSWEGLREMTGEIRAPYVPLEGARESKEFLERSVERYKRLSKKGNVDGGFDMTEICWLQMHNPLSRDERPLLPGQRFPGLGLGRKVAEIMERMSIESKVTDGLINFPMFYHNSAAYQPRGWRYLDPIFEAYVDWVTASLEPYANEHGYTFVAWAVTHGHLRRVTCERSAPDAAWTEISSRLERWAAVEQVYPTSPALKAWFDSEEWHHLYNKWSKRFEEDGGAAGEGVSVVGEMKNGMERKCKLVIDIENATELWKLSKTLAGRKW